MSSDPHSVRSLTSFSIIEFRLCDSRTRIQSYSEYQRCCSFTTRSKDCRRVEVVQGSFAQWWISVSECESVYFASSGSFGGVGSRKCWMGQWMASRRVQHPSSHRYRSSLRRTLLLAHISPPKSTSETSFRHSRRSRLLPLCDSRSTFRHPGRRLGRESSPWYLGRRPYRLGSSNKPRSTQRPTTSSSASSSSRSSTSLPYLETTFSTTTRYLPVGELHVATFDNGVDDEIAFWVEARQDFEGNKRRSQGYRFEVECMVGESASSHSVVSRYSPFSLNLELSDLALPPAS